MSSHDNEELIDYEDEHDVVTNGTAAPAATNGAPATSAAAADGESEKDKKNFSGIHSTGFRLVLSHNVEVKQSADASILPGTSC